MDVLEMIQSESGNKKWKTIGNLHKNRLPIVFILKLYFSVHDFACIIYLNYDII